MPESNDLVQPPASASENAYLKNMEEYQTMYQKSIDDPDGFWSEMADDFHWYSKWDEVRGYNYDRREGPISIEWFKGAKTNVCYNCVDRHLEKRADKTAIIWEGNEPGEDATISYRQLHQQVSKFANVLKSRGVKKGDRVSIYMPMVPEAAVAMLACARIGAVHSVVFGGFSAEALADRIVDSNCKTLITANGTFRGAKAIPMKPNADQAMASASERMGKPVETCIVVRRVAEDSGITCNMGDGRDLWWDEAMADASDDCPCEEMDAEDPLFVLYTSGSTGQPKGVMHTSGGYMVYTATTHKYIFDYQEKDVYFCAADIGWITGHSYIVYGPLANGATTVMFEGVPSYPDYSRFWDIIDKHKITQLYTAPTAIRALAKESLDYVTSHDLSSLRILGTVGEPINEEAWHWYNDHIGKKKCPIVDTWWQTETGGILISPIPFVTPTIPTYATLPLPGIQPALMDENGEEIKGNQVDGRLCIKFPWPSIARTIWGDHQRYKDTYFSAFKGMYFTGDGALRDEVGYYRITGRVDDVIIVSGHNLGTAPIEDSINEHPAVAESAIVGFPHDIKGNALYGYVILKETGEGRDRDNLRKEINQVITEHIGPIAKLDKIQFVSGLPKTRSGKIMRRILRKIASKDTSNLGDTSTLLNPEVVAEIMKDAL